MRSRTLGITGLAVATLLAVAPNAGADPAGPPGDKAAPNAKERRSERAVAALERVEEIFAGGRHHRSEADAHAHGRSATLALRDLRTLQDALPAAQRPLAEDFLARPAAVTRSCATNICVHWTNSGVNAPDLTDGNGNAVPDYVDQVRDTTQDLHSTYVAAGYRAPLPDGSLGGDARTDIYIENLGDDGIYGYCTSDDPNNPETSGVWNVWAYCVLDDDYAPAEFPSNTPLENMRVTAAHEYFHAVQFAYDGWEDGWIMEATATWAEDETFDGVDDNRFYLPHGPIGHPELPLDVFQSGGLHQYGTWIFFRYLTEKFPAEAGGLPVLVRDMWRRMDGGAGGPDDYSLQAVDNVLAGRSTTIPRELSLFADANRHPARSYDEGASYPVAPLAARVRVSGASRDPGAFSRRLDHLASTTVQYVPRNLSQSDWRLELKFDLADTSRGSAAVVSVHKRNGSISTSRVALDSSGNARKVVAFSSGAVKWVDVTLVNGSERFTCWQGSPYSCQGTPLDDNVLEKVNPRAFRS